MAIQVSKKPSNVLDMVYRAYCKPAAGSNATTIADDLIFEVTPAERQDLEAAQRDARHRLLGPGETNR